MARCSAPPQVFSIKRKRDDISGRACQRSEEGYEAPGAANEPRRRPAVLLLLLSKEIDDNTTSTNLRLLPAIGADAVREVVTLNPILAGKMLDSSEEVQARLHDGCLG